MANRVYLSGPMTGYPDFNYKAFHDAAEFLRSKGFEVFNPADSFGGDKTKDRTDYMRVDLAEVTKCTHIAVLDGWAWSRGARAEMRAAIECGLDIMNAATGDNWAIEDVGKLTADVVEERPLLDYDHYGHVQPVGTPADHQQFATGAVRDVQEGKPRHELISPFASDRLALHLAAGAKKYTDRNWEKGIPIGRSLASALRHIESFRRGETDEDHLTAAYCNLMFMLDHDERIKRGLLPPELNDMPQYIAAKGVNDEES